MNKTNYNDIFEKTAAERRGDKLLLHCCCAPCTLGVVERVTAFFDVTLYWYNPNIMPRAEHDKRLTELRRVADIFSLRLIEGGYDNDAYCDMTKEMRFEAEGGARCFACIDMRLAAAACFADENDFDFSNPAPEKLDFRILRQATSRTPIVGEESAEPYSSLILEAKETDAPAQSPQTIDTVETVTAEIPAPAPTANEQAPVAAQYAADAQGQNENAAPSAAATDAADTAQNTEETAKTAEETQPVADERQAEIAPTAAAPMPPDDNRNADKKDSPIPPLYITRTEVEKNYKEIVSRIYHTARSRHDADAVKENEAPLPRDEEAFASENSAAFADEAPQAAREAQPLRRENEAEGQRYAQASEPTVRYNEQAEPPARPLTPGRIDFRDVEEMARYDGLRVWTAGSATQKRQMPEDFFNKGLTLLRASLIFFAVAITETVLAAVFRESLQLEVWYLITMLVCAVLPPAICTILYLIKFQPCCKRLKNNTSVYNGIVAFIATFILLVAVDLIADVSLTDGLTVVQFIVIPLVYLLNIIVFAVAYYLLSRSKV